LDDLSIGDKGVLRSPTTTVLEFIYVFRSSRVYLMKLGALTLGAYRMIIVISFWCISPFISMECPSLSCLINVKFEVYFVQDNYCYSYLFWWAIDLVNFLPAFHPKPCLFLSMRWVSCYQQIVGSSFLIQFAKLCLLMGELSPLTFSVSIDRYMVSPVI
jgi:hypothetical protein